MESIDAELLMNHTCMVFKNEARHLDFCVTNASVVAGTLHFGVALRSNWLTAELIDGLMAACREVTTRVLGVEFEGVAYVPRGWTETTGSAGQANAASSESVLPDKEPGSAGGVEETGTRRRRRSRSSSQS